MAMVIASPCEPGPAALLSDVVGDVADQPKLVPRTPVVLQGIIAGD
jgi:hypothetical protein